MQRRTEIFWVTNTYLLLTMFLAPSCGGTEQTEIPDIGRSFFVDSQAGDDGYDGRSPEKAWRTLSAVNDRGFEPGDRILFKAGTVYRGQLRPRGSGRLVEGTPQPIAENKPRD